MADDPASGLFSDEEKNKFGESYEKEAELLRKRIALSKATSTLELLEKDNKYLFKQTQTLEKQLLKKEKEITALQASIENVQKSYREGFSQQLKTLENEKKSLLGELSKQYAINKVTINKSAKQNSKFEQKMSEKDDLIKNLEEEKRDMLKEISLLTSEKQNLNSVIASVREESHLNSTTVATQEAQILDLNEQIIVLDQSIREKEELIGQTVNEKQDIDQTHKESIKKIEELENQNSDLLSRINQLNAGLANEKADKEQLEELIKSREDQISNKDDEVDELKNEIKITLAASSTQREAFSREKEVLLEKLQTLTEQLEAVHDSKNNLLLETEDLSNRIKDKENDTENLKKDILILESALSEKDQVITDSASQISQKDDEIADITSKIQLLQGDLRKKEDGLENLNIQLKSNNEELARRDDLITELSGSKQELQNHIEQLNDALSEKEKENQQLVGRLNKTIKEYDVLEAKRSALQDHLEEYKQSTKDQVEALKAELKEKKTLSQNLSKDLNKTRAALEKLEKVSYVGSVVGNFVNNYGKVKDKGNALKVKSLEVAKATKEIEKLKKLIAKRENEQLELQSKLDKQIKKADELLLKKDSTINELKTDKHSLKNQLGESNGNIASLNDKIFKFEKEIDERKEDVRALEKRIEEKTEAYQVVVSDIGNLNEKIHDISNKFEIATKSLSDRETVIQQKDAEIKNIQVLIQESQKMQDLSKEQIFALNSEKEIMQKEIDDLGEQLKENKQRLSKAQDDIQSLHSDLSSKEEEISENQDKIEEKEQLFLQKQSEIFSLSERVSLLSNELEVKSDNYESLQNTLTEKINELSGNIEKIDNLNASKQELQNQIDQLNQGLNEKDNENEQLIGRLNKAIKEYDDLDAKRSALEDYLEEYKQSTNDQIVALKAELKEKKTLTQKLSKDLKKTKAALEKLENVSYVGSVVGNFVTNYSKVKDKSNALKVKSLEVARATKEIEKLKQLIANHENDRLELQARLDEQIKKTDDLLLEKESAIDELNSDKNRLSDQLSEMDANVTSLKDEILKFENEIGQREEDVIALEKRIEEKTREIEIIASEKDALINENIKKIEIMDASLDEKEHSIETLTEQISSLDQKMHEIQTNYDSAINILSEKGALVQRLENEIIEVKNKFGEISDERDKLLGEIEKLTEEHRLNVQDVKDQVAVMYKERQSELIHKLDSAESKIKEYPQIIAGLEKAKNESTRELESYKLLLGQKQKANEMLVEDIEAMTRTKNIMAEKLQRLTSELELMRSRYNKLDKMSATIDNLEVENQAMKLKMKLQAASSQKRADLEFEIYNEIMKLYAYISEKDPSNQVVATFLSKGMNDDDKEKVFVALSREISKLETVHSGYSFSNQLNALLR